MSLNPGIVYWMDIFSHLFVVKLIMCVSKDENKLKEAGVGPFFRKRKLIDFFRRQ